MNSAEYWKKREAEQLKHYIADEKEYDKQIKQIYSDMLAAIQKEINAFYGKYAAKEGITLAEAKKRVSQLDIAAYERKAKRYVKDKDFSEQANEEMRLYNATMKINRLEMLKANLGLELISGHDELEKFMNGILQGRTEEELKRQAGILGKTIKNPAQKAHAIVNASFHNATFSNRIWLYQDLMKAELAKLLKTGLIQGKNPNTLARELKKQFDVRRSDAERLMRTELARVQTGAQKQSFERNGFTEYEFIVNGGCCDICAGLSGKHFKVDKMMPGVNAPPMHPYCRCSTAAYEDSADYEAWLEHLEKGGTTEEWEKLKAEKTAAQKRLENSKNSNIIDSGKLDTAASVEEAEKKALKFADNVTYKGANVELANVVNDTLEELSAKFPIRKLKEIITKDIASDAQANGAKIEFAKKTLSAAELLSKYTDKFEKWQKEIDLCYELMQKEKNLIMKMRYKVQAERLEEKMRFNRWSIADNATTPNEVVRRITIHEYAHILADQKFGQLNGEKYVIDKNNLSRCDIVDAAMAKAYETGDIYNLSAYGATSVDEFFAECFAADYVGESLPKYITDMLKECLK